MLGVHFNIMDAVLLLDPFEVTGLTRLHILVTGDLDVEAHALSRVACVLRSLVLEHDCILLFVSISQH